MYDGAGNEVLVLDIYSGDQNNWTKEEVPVDTVLDMHAELGRFYFYGVDHPDGAGFFGIQVRDDDGSLNPADWLMADASDEPEEWTHYETYSGTQLLDWNRSDAFISVEVSDY